jgi:hypothetical protein
MRLWAMLGSASIRDPAGGCRADRRGLGAALDEAQIGKAAQKFLDRA